MRNFLISFIVFSLVSTSFARGVSQFENFATVENTAEKLCLFEDGRPENFISDYQRICPLVRESELCQQVDEKDRLGCKDPAENSLNIKSLSFMKKCSIGLLKSAKELLEFIVGGIWGILGYTFSSAKRNEINDKGAEYYDVLENYVAIEMDREKEHHDSEFDAGYAVAKKLFDQILSSIGKLINDTYYGLGCYGQAARQERVCKLFGDLTFPPTAALVLFFKGPKALAIYPAAKNALEAIKTLRAEKMKLVDGNHPVLRKKSRDLTEEEAQSQQFKRLADRMEATMKLKLGAGIAAPQVGQSISLIIAKVGGQNIRMVNPRIKPVSDVKKSGIEGCLSLPGNACSIERYKEIRVDYLDMEGKPQSLNLKGRDAVVVQHEVDHLDGVILPFKSESYPKKFGIKNTKELSPVALDRLNRWLHGLSKEEKKRLKQHKKKFSDDIKDLNNPNSVVFMMRESGLDTSEEVFDELLKLQSIRIRDGPTGKRYKDMDNWVQSEVHALYLYDRLSSEGLEINKDILRYLRTHNEYFKKAHGTRGPPSLITYAFEKESKSKDITLWYKKAGVSDDDWLALDDAERLKQLQKATNVKKKVVSIKRIEPTAERPHWLGGYTEELQASDMKGYTWEIAHKKYEIDLDRTMDHVADVAKFTGEKHSFHTHIVFDMPKDYQHFDDFSLWAKQTNDYLYLRGMEEGLHGNKLTDVAHLSRRELRHDIGSSSISPTMPQKLESVGYQSHKFFSMGIRADLYGKSPLKDHQKLGLELRDSTRDLDQLTDHMQNITRSVENYSWENVKAADIDTNKVMLIRTPEQYLKKLDGKVSPEVIEIIAKTEPNGIIPLQAFETKKYLDYKTGRLLNPTREQIERISNARKQYIEELKKLGIELSEMKAKGEKYAPEEVAMAIKMSLTEWARAAKLSELFSNIN